MIYKFYLYNCLNQNNYICNVIFIEGLNDGDTEVIYVPTEANIPILEVED